MVYSVRFRVDLESLPRDVRERIGRTLREVAEAISTIPSASPFWDSMRHSQTQIDVKGWRVVYRIQQSPSELVVVEVARIPPA
jgi:mRNA-degrading endonuclease RelE of RelBE toxin-antitoxin system